MESASLLPDVDLHQIDTFGSQMSSDISRCSVPALVDFNTDVTMCSESVVRESDSLQVSENQPRRPNIIVGRVIHNCGKSLM